MSKPVTTGELPALTAPDDPELHHITCCCDDTAMCGADVSGQAWVEDEDNELPVCPMCYLAEEDGLPCTVLGCPGGYSDE